MNTIFKEPDYKAVTIDWLFNKGLLDHDAVLINELPISNFTRRVDLVVANGKLHAIEIKSDADSLTRLEGQIETYLQYFDKVTLVCSHKFTEKAKSLLPKEVEIIEFTLKDHNPCLSVKQRGKTQLVSSVEHFLSFLDKKQLIQILKNKRFACQHGESKAQLLEKATKLPKSYWRTSVLACLKEKYSARFETFIAHKHKQTTISDLNYLSPTKDILSNNTTDCSIDYTLNTGLLNSNSVDISENLTRMGFINQGIVHAIPRLKS